MIDLHNISKHDFGRCFELLSLGGVDEADVREGCRIAKEYNLRSYMVASCWVPVVAEEFAGADIKVGCGAGFPLGGDPPVAKEAAIRENIRRGANSLDFSINYNALRAGRVEVVQEELDRFADAAGELEKKVIIEVCMLSDDDVKRVIEMIVAHGINWVKSSTGQFAGPTMHQMKLMTNCLKGTGIRLKVSGVKAPRPQNAYAYIKAGAEIIGSQGAVEIIEALDLHRSLGLI